jgi:hypothetical protein
LRKHIEKYGLITLFYKDPSFVVLVRHIWALAFVPLDQIVPIWECLIADLVSKALNVYDDKTYNDKTYTKTKHIMTKHIQRQNV